MFKLYSYKRQYYVDLNGDLHPPDGLLLLLKHHEDGNFTTTLSLFETNGLRGQQQKPRNSDGFRCFLKSKSRNGLNGKDFSSFFKAIFRTILGKKIPQKIEKTQERYLSLNIWTHHYLEYSSKFHWCLQTVSNWTACFSRVFESWSATGKSRQFLCKKTLLYTSMKNSNKIAVSVGRLLQRFFFH